MLGAGIRRYHSNDLRNRWSHWAHIFNGTQVIVYIDGNSVSNWTRGEISTGNADAFQFGRWRNDGNAYFQGILDDFRVYDSALDGQEVQQIYASQDLEEQVVEHQFTFSASGDPSGYSVSGLPSGLSINQMTGEITGLPIEVGVFDLNVSAFNLAGEGQTTIRLIVNKTGPRVSSVEPRGVTSSSAKMSGRVLSDGGEDVQMSLFWGETDGGSNSNVNPADGNLWDYRVDLPGTFRDGMVSYNIDNLDLNSSYYYRWMAGNSVNSEVWSVASEEGMLAWWSLDESFNPFSVDRVRGRKAIFVGLTDSDRVFGRKGNAIRLAGAGEHLVVKGFTGIVNEKERTTSLWVKTTDSEGSLIRWGSAGTGRLWELEIVGGTLNLDAGNARLESNTQINDGNWHHLAVVLPSSAERLGDVVLYVDGSIESVNSTGNPLILTGDDYDLMIGTDSSGGNFGGTIDEIRLYERGLSQSEIKSIYLDGLLCLPRLPLHNHQWWVVEVIAEAVPASQLLVSLWRRSNRSSG